MRREAEFTRREQRGSRKENGGLTGGGASLFEADNGVVEFGGSSEKEVARAGAQLLHVGAKTLIEGVE